MIVKVLTPRRIPHTKRMCCIIGWRHVGTLAIETPGAQSRGWVMECTEDEFAKMQENDFFYLCSNGDQMLRGIGIDMKLSIKKFAELARISNSQAYKILTHLVSQGYLRSTRDGRQLIFEVAHGT